MTGHGGMCRAVSQRGSTVTAYIDGLAVLVIPKRDGDFICTQDTGHEKSHASCDGHGHILARWQRSSVERYWQHGDCDGCDHERTPGVTR
jgi:hypothetical protein